MDTNIATSSALAKKLFSENLYRDVLAENYWTKFMSNEPTSIVYTKTNLLKDKGDKETFGLRMRLTGDGVEEGETLLGKEEALSLYDFSLELKEVAHAVTDSGPMSRQRSAFDLSVEMESAIREWLTDKMEKDGFSAMFDPTPSKIFYGGSASSTATLASGDKLTPALISKVQAWAKTGGSRDHVPLRPVKIEGQNYYVLLISPDQEHDLFVDTTWADRVKDAADRGPKNPLFTGALGVWKNCIIHSHEYVPLYTNWGSGANVAGSKSVLMGAQALCWAMGRKPEIVNEKQDWGRKDGYGVSAIYGVEKPVFNSKDFGSVAIYTSRTQIG